MDSAFISRCQVLVIRFKGSGFKGSKVKVQKREAKKDSYIVDSLNS